MNSGVSSTMRHKEIPRAIIGLFLAASFAGFIDATYLAIKHFLNEPVLCSLLRGCEVVTTSSYATVGPIPVALLGAFYYLIIFLVGIFYLDTKNLIAVGILMHLPIAGFVASLWFVYLQLFVLRSICLYCMVSAGTSIVLFGLGMFVKRKTAW